jgi:hypothetical protein
MKFVELGNFKLPRAGTREFTELQEKISRNLRATEISKVPGFVDVAVINFFSRQDGEFETDIVVLVDKNEFESEESPLTVEAALKDTVSRGRIGIFKVQPSSLSLDGVGKFVVTDNKVVIALSPCLLFQ